MLKRIALVGLTALALAPALASAIIAPPPDDYGNGDPETGIYCPKLSQTMRKGARDSTTNPRGQVSELQAFLTDYYDLDENILVGGFFGRLTHGYVVRFQSEHGLPAYGIVGSMTRAKIAQVCGGRVVTPPNPFPGVTLQVKPDPINPSNTFVAWVNVGQWTYYTWELDWGEGDASQQTYRSRVVVVCNSQWTCASPPGQTHMYPAPGLYTVNLYAVKVTDTEQRIRTLAATVTARAGEPGPLRISLVSGNKDAYAPGESFSLVVKGVEQDGTAATPDEGYNVQVYVRGANDNYTYQGLNGTYNPSTGYWSAQLTAPTDASKTYVVEAILYCSNRNLVCGSLYSSNPTDGKGQVSASYRFSLASVLPGQLTLLAPARGETIIAGSLYSIRWSATPEILRLNSTADVVLVGMRSPGCDPYGCGMGPVRNFFSWVFGVGTAEAEVASEVMIQSNVALSQGVLPWLVTQDMLNRIYSYNNQYKIYFLKPGTRQQILPYTDNIFTILPSPVSDRSITVTAPNGGEQWEIGQLNTITWSPYGYNPDINPAKDVNVFLERADGTTAGQIMDTGKASLHTYFNIGGYNNWATPGQYRVYIGNKVTGATDRSDGLFTLLPRAVDLKVNGSDGPIVLTNDQMIAVTLVTTPDVRTCTVYGVRSAEGGNGPVQFGPPINSSPTEFKAYATFAGNSAIYTTCQKSDGSLRSDSVQVNVTGTVASIHVLSPNGGETIDPTRQWDIKTRINGLKTLSLALYKNDQWFAWLARDMSTEGRPSDFEWIHSHSPIRDTYPDLAFGSPAVFKIYATGQRADGTGYVDDKSDSQFSFGPWQYPQIDIKANGLDGPLSVVKGSTITLAWTGRGNIWGCYLREEITQSSPVYTESTSTFAPAAVYQNQQWSITCSTTQDGAPGGFVKDTVFVNVY